MLKNIFKKKITPNHAAGLYLESLVMVLERTWTKDYETINSIKDTGITDFDPNIYRYELMIAIIALEFQVIKNLLPEKYLALTESVYENIKEITNYEEATDYALSTIQKIYIPQIEEVIREMLPPWEGVLSTLLSKIEIEFDTIIAMQFIEIISSKMGGWKYILSNYKIIQK